MIAKSSNTKSGCTNLRIRFFIYGVNTYLFSEKTGLLYSSILTTSSIREPFNLTINLAVTIIGFILTSTPSV